MALNLQSLFPREQINLSYACTAVHPSTKTVPGEIMNTLSGKTALVTGASRGIGRATALALAKAGAQVLIHYSSSEKEADAVVAEIRKAGGRAEKVGADLRQGGGPHLLAKQGPALSGGTRR